MSNLIQNTKSYLFISIPKTGSISICKAFGLDILGHQDLQYYKLNKYHIDFVFCFVRNPYDRVVSIYHYLKSGGVNSVDRSDKKTFIDPYKNFEDFVINGLNENLLRIQQHFRPQYEYIYFNGSIKCDFIGLFESIRNDFEHLKSITGFSGYLSHYNKSEHPQWQDLYTSEMRDKVFSLYERDFEFFNYKK